VIRPALAASRSVISAVNSQVLKGVRNYPRPNLATSTRDTQLNQDHARQIRQVIRGDRVSLSLADGNRTADTTNAASARR
jgi:hypothetical protein